MKVIRVEIQTWTSSFRYPMFVVSHQPTYDIAPISTVYGMLSFAKGEPINIYDVSIGYDFVSRGKYTDVEHIWEYGDKNPKHSIIHRDILFDCILNLYISDLNFETYLKTPANTLLLGRQDELAIASKIAVVDLVRKKNVVVNNTFLPFDENIPGQIVRLPAINSIAIKRQPIEMKMYSMVTNEVEINNGYYDAELDKGVYIHKFEKSKNQTIKTT